MKWRHYHEKHVQSSAPTTGDGTMRPTKVGVTHGIVTGVVQILQRVQAKNQSKFNQ